MKVFAPCFLLCFLLFVDLNRAQILIQTSRASTGSTSDSNNQKCEEKCEEKYTEESNSESCNRGCRLAAIVDALDFTTSEDLNQTIDKCENSCSSSYESTKELSESCQRGCVFMAPILQQRRKSMLSPTESFFGPFGGLMHQLSLPRVFVSGTPKIIRIKPDNDEENTEIKRDDKPESGIMDSFFGGNSGFQDMFSRMNQLMKNTMEQLHAKLPDMMKGGENSGRMVVFRSGPGYQETKTYNMGEDGKFELKDVERSGNEGELKDDMMEKDNPLDSFFSNDEFEKVIKEELEDEDSDESSEEDFGLSDNNRNGLFDVEVFDPIDNHIRDDVEEPRLPENGLKTRYIHSHVCAERSADMKWSDWVSCIHMRIGMPRWLTAATISLGIVFALWLCLAIPQNAPRQRIVVKSAMSKSAMAKAKEAEANGQVISIVSVKSLDQEKPPAYEDISSETNLRVALAPIHEEQQAEELPKKVPIDNEVSKA